MTSQVRSALWTLAQTSRWWWLKLGYSEKATKIWPIFHFLCPSQSIKLSFKNSFLPLGICDFSQFWWWNWLWFCFTYDGKTFYRLWKKVQISFFHLSGSTGNSAFCLPFLKAVLIISLTTLIVSFNFLCLILDISNAHNLAAF